MTEWAQVVFAMQPSLGVSERLDFYSITDGRTSRAVNLVSSCKGSINSEEKTGNTNFPCFGTAPKVLKHK